MPRATSQNTDGQFGEIAPGDVARASAPGLFARARSALAAATRELRGVSVSTGSLSDPTSDLLGALGLSTRSGAQITEDTAFNVATVSACINILAQSIAMIPLKVYRKTPTGADEAIDHPLSALLKRKPCAAQTSYQWRAWKMTCACLGGNGYSRIYRDTFGQVTELEPLKASDVTVLRRADRSLAYRVRGVDRVLFDYEVLHLRGLSTNGATGRSPLHDMRESVGLAMTAQQFNAATFANGNRQPGLIKGPPTWDRAKATEFKKFWDENYTGAIAAGKNPLIFGGVDWVNSGFTNQDAELLLTRKFEVEEIARVYRVPLTLLQSMEKSTSFGTGIAELSRGFVNYTLLPWLVNWEMELEDKCLTEAEKAEGYFIKFNVGALLRGSPLEQAQKAEIERRSRLITVNEYRRQLDLNEFPDTGANNPEWPLNAQEAGQTSRPDDSADDEPAEPRNLTINLAAPAPAQVHFGPESFKLEARLAQAAAPDPVKVEINLNQPGAPLRTVRHVRDESGRLIESREEVVVSP
jgi:HK97 family phage portal protein